MARFAAQRSCIRADNFARVSTESFRFCRPGGTDAAVGSAFPRIKAFFGRGDVLDAARFTLRINLERRLASFCMLASSFSSFRLKFFNVIIYNSSFPAMRGEKPRSRESKLTGVRRVRHANYHEAQRPFRGRLLCGSLCAGAVKTDS